MKKIRGKIYYFGKWAKRVNGKLVRIEGDGWKEALEEYKAVADDLHAGRTPRVQADGLTVADLCNRFLTAKLLKQKSSEITSRTYRDYKEVTDLLVAAFGKTRLVDDLAADDFEQLRATMAERWGPVRLGNGITRVKTVFKFGTDNGLTEKAVRYGSEFKKPDKAVLRRHRATNGAKMLEAAELRSLLDALTGKKSETGRTDEESGKPETITLTPNLVLRAMILLALNAGFGNIDCARLPMSAVDLDTSWIDFPRPKTGIARRCPLWPETVQAIQTALLQRPEPASEDYAGFVFLTCRGTPWIHFTAEGNRIDNVTIQFTLLLKKLGLHRSGIGFYALRHVFETIAGDSRDQVAVDVVMGHSDPSMGGHYRERIEDSRLRAVAEHVRTWLFGQAPDDTTEPDSETPEKSDSSDPGDLPQQDDARPTLRLYVG
jgi:integrase